MRVDSHARLADYRQAHAWDLYVPVQGSLTHQFEHPMQGSLIADKHMHGISTLLCKARSLTRLVGQVAIFRNLHTSETNSGGSLGKLLVFFLTAYQMQVALCCLQSRLWQRLSQ